MMDKGIKFINKSISTACITIMWSTNGAFRGIKMNYNLKIDTQKSFDGRFDISSVYVEAPFHKQNLLINSSGLHLVSPAELGFMRTDKPKNHAFMKYSRSSMSSLMIPEEDKIVLVKSGALSNLYARDLVNAHADGKECLIPKEDKEMVYDLVTALERAGLAKTINPGNKTLSAKLDEETSDFMFSDDDLRIKSSDYGRTLVANGRGIITAYFDDADYMKKQKGMYLNIVRVRSPADIFNVYGSGNWNLGDDDGAFGVNFVPVEGAQKIVEPEYYTIDQLLKNARSINLSRVHIECLRSMFADYRIIKK
jgi:hypothetical protein